MLYGSVKVCERPGAAGESGVVNRREWLEMVKW